MEDPRRTVVMKFGGTSVADAEAIGRLVRHVKTLLARRTPAQRPVVVVSALSGVTDRLLSLATAAERGDSEAGQAGIEALRTRHLQIVAAAAPHSAAHLAVTLDGEFARLRALLRALDTLGHASPRILDAIAGLGELLSSRIVHAALADAGVAAVWVDARRAIVTDDHFTAAAPLGPETDAGVAREVRPLVDAGQVPVMGGYVAATRDGIMTTLGRGGSDYSAAIVGAALGAAEIQIWTDVDGMMTADPRLVAASRVVPRLTFGEASELAHFGAKVLHPATIVPAIAKGIPVRILNSRCFDRHGTVIAGASSRQSPIAAVACKRGISLVSITSTRALTSYAFLRRVFDGFERHRTPVDLVTMSEAGVSVTVEDDRRLEAIVQSLGDVAEVHVEHAMAIVCAVGDGLRDDPMLAARMLGALEALPVRMVSQTASRRGLALVVRDSDARIAVSRLHAEIFEATAPPELPRMARAGKRSRPARAAGLELQP
jgi:aspartate kinase